MLLIPCRGTLDDSLSRVSPAPWNRRASGVVSYPRIPELKSSVVSVNANFTLRSRRGPSAKVSDHPQRTRDTAWAMSQENVERVKVAFAAHNRGDLDAWLDLYDPEVEFETLLLGAHQGKEAMRRLYHENQANQSGYTATPVELIDTGDKLVTVVEVGGAGIASHIALDDQIAFIHTFKDGLVVREQTFRNREEALQAAGLSE